MTAPKPQRPTGAAQFVTPPLRKLWRHRIEHDAELSALAKAVALAADSGEVGWPDWTDLAERHGVSESDVFEAVAELRRRKLIQLLADGFIFRAYARHGYTDDEIAHLNNQWNRANDDEHQQHQRCPQDPATT